jgi:hypothetical protein
MADEKKPDAKAPAPAASPDPLTEVIWAIAGILLLSYILTGIVSSINSSRIFSRGLSGLTPRGIFLAHTRPIASLDTALNTRIVAINKTDVYKSPEGGKVGEQKMYARGEIIQGPVIIPARYARENIADGSSVRYWYVDFDKEPDGWVYEGDIAYQESELNFIERLLFKILSFGIYFKLFIALFCLVCIIFIIYLFQKIMKFRLNEDKLLYPQNPEIAEAKNPAWERILDHIDSANPNDWRLAIIEADIMLGDILDKLSLPGDTIGEKLKSVEKSDFTTVESAWEAHKIRNQIAHQGESFKLNQHEAKRVVALYMEVFEEFQII